MQEEGPVWRHVCLFPGDIEKKKKKKKNRILHLTVFSLSVGGDRRRLQGQF